MKTLVSVGFPNKNRRMNSPSFEHALVDAVSNLCAQESQDDELQHSLSFFKGSMSSLVSCLRSCCREPNDQISAACSILVRLFNVSLQSSEREKVEPFEFDEVAIALRESDALVLKVQRFCSEIDASLSTVAKRCGMSLNYEEHSIKNELIADASRTSTIHLASTSLTTVANQLGLFFSDTVRLHRTRFVESVEIEKRLAFCSASWEHFNSLQRQRIGECVAAELQCRLEQRWVSQFLDYVQQKFADANLVRSFELVWHREWNKKREVIQDRLLLEADAVLAAAKDAVKQFPVSLVVPEQLPLVRESVEHTTAFARNLAAELSRARSPATRSVNPISRPRQAMSRALSALQKQQGALSKYS